MFTSGHVSGIDLEHQSNFQSEGEESDDEKFGGLESCLEPFLRLQACGKVGLISLCFRVRFQCEKILFRITLKFMAV